MSAATTTLRWVVPALIGIAIGGAVAWWATGINAGGLQAVPGHPEWRHSQFTGSGQANPFTRAAVARFGLLAQNRSQAAYYGADVDDEGHALLSACDYTVTGKLDMPGQWWSVTLYASDNFLAQNRDDANHVGSTDVVTTADGNWLVRVAPTRDGAANWLSTRNAGHNFFLSLRLYQPSAAVLSGAIPNLPTVKRVSCRNGGAP